MTRTITALYDSRDRAESARSQLTEMGLEPSAIQITAGEAGETAASGASHGEGRGFLQSLKEFFMPDEDRHAYGEGLRRGGYLLTARVDDTQADDVCQLLDDSGAIDLDERQAEWRAAGWTGRVEADEADRGYREAGAEETIPVVEERLRVGKREVERGGVRVRSYIEETPVEEQIGLRTERVEVERRPVDEPVRGGAGADRLFEERSIELTERAEEPVVAKEAVVREEIGLRKEVDQRTETISDTVRRTEVDIDDTRGDVGGDDYEGQRRETDRGLTGERASFASDNDDDDHSIAMDPEGERIEETEEERRRRLDHDSHPDRGVF